MEIPAYVLDCIQALEAAGYEAYAVGGCVRDALLGKSPHDYDLCTGAQPEETEAVFRDRKLILAGKKHGTVGVITDGGVVEITTFRREGTYQDNRRPDWVEFVSDIREDLARRDFTVNAMAYSPSRGYADPFGGKEDLQAGILRAVGDPTQRFREDSLRILRGVRFAVTYGLAPDPETERAMLAQAPLMDNLARERVFEELSRILTEIDAPQLLRYSRIFAQVIPELAPMIGFDQHSPHHAYDVFTHTANVTESVPGELTVRWAALLHDIGKVPTFTQDENGRGHFYGHATVGAEMADVILRRLKAPTALRERAVLLIGQHMTRLRPDKKLLKRQLSKHGMEAVREMLLLQEADMSSKGILTETPGEYFREIRSLLEEIIEGNSCLSLKDLAVDGNDLMALGFTGRAIGNCLNDLLQRVLEEQLPNEREALLQAAEAEITRI